MVCEIKSIQHYQLKHFTDIFVQLIALFSKRENLIISCHSSLFFFIYPYIFRYHRINIFSFFIVVHPIKLIYSLQLHHLNTPHKGDIEFNIFHKLIYYFFLACNTIKAPITMMAIPINGDQFRV